MPTITRKDYSLGWIPSDDAVNGRKNGLLVSNNLHLGDQGIVSLTRAMKKVSVQFSDPIFNIYSKNFGGSKHRYVNSGTVVRKDTGGTSFSTTVLSGGTNRTAFGGALGQVLITSGTQKKKDDGSTIRDLGVPTPSAPLLVLDTIAEDSPATPTLDIDEGTAGGSQEIVFDAVTFGAIFRHEYSSVQQWHIISSGSETPDDVFTLKFSTTVPINYLRLDILLDTNASLGNDYFTYTFLGEKLPKGVDTFSAYTVTRKEFERIGNDPAFSWATVRGIRVSVQGNEAGSITYLVNSVHITGGTSSKTGSYEYRTVNVLNTGQYVGKSPPSPISNVIAYAQGINVDPVNQAGFGSTFNEIWVFRKNTALNDTYYRVAVRTINTTFLDDTSEATAIENNIRIDDILFLAYVPDFITGIEGLYYERMIYMTPDALYITPRLNIDAIDTRFTLDTSNDNVEKNLWIKKTSAASLLLGTTKDIYELTGTGQLFPDGTIDFRLVPMGVSNPPISRACCIYDGAVCYMAKDGWRIVSGSRYESIITETRLLFEGETRYNIPPVEIKPDDLVQYGCAVTRNKLWTTNTKTDSGRISYVLDLLKGYWYPYFVGPMCYFAEDDGTLLGGFGDPGDRYLREMDFGTLIDGTQQQQIRLLTPFDDFDAANRRKDLFTLKVFLNTSGSQVTISLAKDGGSLVSLGSTFIASGPTLLNIPVNATSLQLGKTFQLEIKNTGLGVANFDFYHWSLDFEPRPEQLNHLRLAPNNYGSAGRKRFYEIPISIDTLGNTVALTPIIDGTLQASENIVSSGKLYKNYLFPSEAIGRELGWDLQASGNGIFEFYEIIDPKNLEILPDPSKFLHLPYDNLGVPSRKRFMTIAFVIDTRGSNVTFTPRLDGATFPTSVVNTSRKQTYIHYFVTEALGIDIGGELSGSSEFEFYGWLKEDTVYEKLPPPAKFVNLGCTNFGIAARKRVRTVPFVLDTKGSNVTITPVVDGIATAPSIHNTSGRRTVFHYFTTDVFGVDYCFSASGAVEFEFYEMLKPYQVEILPVARKLDQVGPITISRIGKLREILLRILPTTSPITLELFCEGQSVFLRNITVDVNIDNLYRIDVPKTVKGTTFRLVISATDIFHRFYADFRYVEGGNENTLKKVRIDDASNS